ncbi:uncharacterized protein PHACADRAFT_31058 [Phanerochaete carnosa HHB-10118-sp]|uniref:MULE transposase domain-containing protein n=1 Tax=Phanerochaete carnosa (strain HHB-10118-sp) TaxID=650164 RepID=K5URN7_PHACS|nr:uncharacterized protein PHACADRAFT_31058 [Phanerochaete carnosa HHB-10118-sp]EKM52561.1 hypothetical protein PHACADRAFT_31058 [Phanerochaete carnosa HHB-10118-sp]
MPFTACLAYVEVNYVVQSKMVLSIRGYLEHNQECKDAHITWYPPQSVHPEVFKVALAQLKCGADITEVQETNLCMAQAHTYPGKPSVGDFSKSAYHWILRAGDNRSLYCQFNWMHGVCTTTAAHVNIDEWLSPDSPQYNRALANAVFHYRAQTTCEERLKVCIATSEMREAAWKYAHCSQIILDGTFGVCNRKMLLFIVMGIDEEGRGILLAFLLFSAPTKNKQTSARYDAEILTELLREWKLAPRTKNGEAVTVHAAITDTDLMEQNALAAVFDNIWLLICKFHLRQSFRNHCNRVLKGTSPFAHDLKARMKRLETQVVQTKEHTAFLAFIEEEREVLAAFKHSLVGPETLDGLALIYSAQEHLDYLQNYWGREALWQSWSDFGRCVAAVRLGCAVERVLPTTNHLESFNGVFKRKHLKRWQHNGKPL